MGVRAIKANCRAADGLNNNNNNDYLTRCGATFSKTYAADLFQGDAILAPTEKCDAPRHSFDGATVQEGNPDPIKSGHHYNGLEPKI